MGKGSGNCDERPSMVAEAVLPQFQLSEFRRESFSRTYRIGDEAVHVNAFGLSGGPKQYIITIHTNEVTKEVYCNYRQPTPDAASSQYPFALLYGVEFNSYGAVKKALAALTDDPVQYQLNAISYLTSSPRLKPGDSSANS